jgi:hypothetical protein
MPPTIKVNSDYDGYFESLVKGWLKKKENFNHDIISISAGPWRSAAVSYESFTKEKRIHLDFYSALRTGFGLLTESDVAEIIDLL